MTPAAARRGPVTVRTPHDATRDCFSISEPTVTRRSMLALISDMLAPVSTSRSDTWARQAAATRRSPRHHEGPRTLTR